MTRTTGRALLMVCLSLLVACGPAKEPSAEQTPIPPTEFTQLADKVWMHTSYAVIGEWGAFPSNGLIVQDDQAGLVLVDTAWNDEQTEEVLDWVETTFGRPVDLAIFTHAHDDKMGGVAVVRARGALTYAHPLSNKIAPTKGLTAAEFSIPFDEAQAWRPSPGIEVYYPGGGHTVDNIVVALEASGIVFGGCLIRPGFTGSLGNTADAILEAWAGSVSNVSDRYPMAQTIIPSHGPPGDRRLLSNTISLAATP